VSAYAIYEVKDARRLPAQARADALVLVRDGFSWRAFLLSGLWLALRRHWRALALWLGAMVAGAAAVYLLGLGPEALAWLWLALALAVGTEAAGLERDALLAQSGRELGYVTGDRLSDCEAAAVKRLAAVIEAERQASESADA
jgi:hypothetical protein